MGIFRQFPYTNFHEINLNWLLKEMKKLEETMANFFIDIDDKIAADVDEWLTNHPEATTTVMDHSLTSIKFANSVPFYNVNDYGIMPNSGDVYEALHDLIADRVFYTGGILFFPKGKYTLSYTIFVPENTIVLGEGVDSIIYFDESDTEFGVGMCNAGSNVTYENITFSQKTKGTFHTGAQPGCAAFSDIHKEQARANKYSHYFLRGEVHNLAARNLFFDGFYAIQTENSDDYAIHNVIYENLTAPDSCVSVMAGTSTVDNIKISNIDCDLIRINANKINGDIGDVVINNIDCSRFIFGSYNSEASFIINNLIQKTTARKEDVLTSGWNGVINTNVKFNNCIFNCIENEVNGIQLFNGVREYNRCIFNAIDRACSREAAVSDITNYEIMNECKFSFTNKSRPTILIGYGANNDITRSDNAVLLWGDMFRDLSYSYVFAQSTGASAEFANRAKCIGNLLKLEAYLVISNTNNIATLTAAFQNFDIDGAQIPVTIFNSSAPSTRIVTWATIENGVIKIKDPSYADSADYDRVIIDTVVPIKSVPKPSTIVQFF